MSQKIIRKINNIGLLRKPLFYYFEEIVASSFLIITLSLVIVNVITRYVFRTGISWAEEFAVGCFVWTVFLGAAACYKRQAHVKADILTRSVNPEIGKAIKLFVDFFMVILCSGMFYISIIYIHRSFRKTTAILGISSTVFSISIAVSLLDMAIWSWIFLWIDLKKGVIKSSKKL